MIERKFNCYYIYVHLWLNCSFDKILVAWKQTENGLCHVTKHTRNPHASSTADGKERCPKGLYIVHSTVLIFKSDIDYLNLKKKIYSENEINSIKFELFLSTESFCETNYGIAILYGYSKKGECDLNKTQR